MTPGPQGAAGVSELAYLEFTAPVSVPVVAAASAVTVVATGSLILTAVAHTVEFTCPQVVTGGSATSDVRVSLWDGTTDLGVLAVVKNNTNTALNAPVVCRRRLVPTAGAHTFTVKAFAAGQTGSITAGAGGAGALLPGAIRVVRTG